MSRLFAKVAKFFRSRTQVGVDKAGNRYFTRKEEIDGILKENRWVIFKGEEDPTSIPVEWICWLNGQRKKAPTPQELMELEARREHVKLNVAKLKKQEEEKLEHLQQRKGNGCCRRVSSTGRDCHARVLTRHLTGKVAGPDLRSFIQQFPSATPEHKGTLSEDVMDKSDDKVEETRSSEPAGSGSDFKPGIWQPPT